MRQTPGVYQIFCALWYLDRGDVLTASAIMAIPPVMLIGFDDILRGAWLAGAAEAAKGR
jgi:hypothetical protein